MSSQFQIAFHGELLDGFDPNAVKASAGRRLKAAPGQIDRVFSGKRVVLKKGLTDETAQRYAKELERIGMRVSIEPETIKDSAPSVSTTDFDPADPIGAIGPLPLPGQLGKEPQRPSPREESEFDPMKTQISAIDELTPPPERWTQPTIAISQPHLREVQATSRASSHQAASSASAPTMIVPPRHSGSAEPTIVVTRSAANSASSAPTVIVPSRTASIPSDPMVVVPPDHASASAPTMIVPARSSAASEPTMIVPPRHSAASEPTMIVPPKPATSSPGTVIVRSSHSLLPTSHGGGSDAGGSDGEKTLLAGSQALDGNTPGAAEVATRAAPNAAGPAPTPAIEEVQCPTCGDKQPKRVYCRRCGHALSLPPSPSPSPADSAITKRPFPAVSPSAPNTTVETVLEESAIVATKKSAARKSFLAAPTWLTIGLLFVLLLTVAGWLIFS